MAYATTADLVLLLPEFAAVSTTLIDAWIEETKTEIDPGSFKGRQKLAHMYLTAHRLASIPSVRSLLGEDAIAATGPITSKKAGELQVTYASSSVSSSSSGSGASFASTRYGQEYLSLRGSIATRIQVIV